MRGKKLAKLSFINMQFVVVAVGEWGMANGVDDVCVCVGWWMRAHEGIKSRRKREICLYGWFEMNVPTKDWGLSRRRTRNAGKIPERNDVYLYSYFCKSYIILTESSSSALLLFRFNILEIFLSIFHLVIWLLLHRMQSVSIGWCIDGARHRFRSFTQSECQQQQKLSRHVLVCDWHCSEKFNRKFYVSKCTIQDVVCLCGRDLRTLPAYLWLKNQVEELMQREISGTYKMEWFIARVALKMPVMALHSAIQDYSHWWLECILLLWHSFVRHFGWRKHFMVDS